MFVVMAADATEAEVLGVKSHILAEGLTPFDHAGSERIVIAVVGEVGARRPVLLDRFAALPGVERVTPISRPFKLTSREFRSEDTVIRVGDAVIGGGSLTSWPARARSRAASRSSPPPMPSPRPARTILRGGAFKPRTCPYDFQGLGGGRSSPRRGARRTGLPVITEVMEPDEVDLVAEYADVLQIGARNMQNFSLLERRRPGRASRSCSSAAIARRSRSG